MYDCNSLFSLSLQQHKFHAEYVSRFQFTKRLQNILYNPDLFHLQYWLLMIDFVLCFTTFAHTISFKMKVHILLAIPSTYRKSINSFHPFGFTTVSSLNPFTCYFFPSYFLLLLLTLIVHWVGISFRETWQPIFCHSYFYSFPLMSEEIHLSLSPTPSLISSRYGIMFPVK